MFQKNSRIFSNYCNSSPPTSGWGILAGFFKNKNKNKNNAKNVKKWLKDNPDINNALEQYFDPQECLWREKDREPTSIEHFVETMQEENPEIANKMLDQKHLWKAILEYI